MRGRSLSVVVGFTDDPRLPHIAEVGYARPTSAIWITQFNSGELTLLSQQHVDSCLSVPEFCYGASRQREVCRRTTVSAKVDFGRRIVLVFPAVVLRLTSNYNV